MHIILCLDQKDGMLFHHRRQSRDCKVIDDICSNLSEQKLYIQPYSEKLFLDYPNMVSVTEELTDSMTCFLEQPPSIEILARCDFLTIYRWDKVYPADQKLEISLSQWHLQKTETFPGNSHAVITKETYTR